jgi:DNA-binding transcriptional LysR family regulator
MNLRKLEAFILVIEKKSFSEAAAYLKCSQPAISQQIKSLEDDLNISLLDRSSPIIQPTPAGNFVYQMAKEIISKWNEMENGIRTFHETLTGTLIIGASTIPGTYLVPQWISEFRRLYPKIEVTVEISDSEKILTKLLNHQIDVGIIGLKPNSKKIKVRAVASDSLVLIAPNNHPLVTSNNNDFKALQEYDFVLREEGSGTRKVMEEYLSQYGLKMTELNSVVCVGSTEALIASVEEGIGISCVSKLAATPASKTGRIQILEGYKPFHRNFYFSTLIEKENHPIIKKFSEILPKKVR